MIRSAMVVQETGPSSLGWNVGIGDDVRVKEMKDFVPK